MATVEINDAAETPTQEIVRQGRVEHLLTLPPGLPVATIHYRRLGAIERRNLYALAGPQNATNIAWLAETTPVYAITRIDGKPVPKPQTLAQLDAQIQRIGDDAFDLLSADVVTTLSPEDPSQIKEQAGN